MTKQKNLSFCLKLNTRYPVHILLTVLTDLSWLYKGISNKRVTLLCRVGNTIMHPLLQVNSEKYQLFQNSNACYCSAQTRHSIIYGYVCYSDTAISKKSNYCMHATVTVTWKDDYFDLKLKTITITLTNPKISKSTVSICSPHMQRL